MKTAILTFEQFHGKKGLGSSRIRGHWLIKNWKAVGADLGEAELFKFGAKYDCVIYQKAYFVEHARAFKGIKILDLCDPDWLIWNSKMKEMMDEVDAVTCSSEVLAKEAAKFTNKPVFYVPDRIDLTEMLPAKVHTGPTKKVAWFGYAHNFPMLNAAVKTIADLKLELIVISEGVYAPPASVELPFSNLPFSEHYMHDLQQADVVINPQWQKGKWKYKSDNKTATARALGMPVAHDGEELKLLLTEEARVKAAAEGLEWVRKERDVLQSVVDMKDVILETQKTKETKS